MTIGSLGGVVFAVSDNQVQSFKKYEVSGSAKIAGHDLHLTKQRLEFTGSDPDKVSITILLAKVLGSSPAAEIAKIKAYTDSGAVVRLQIGRSGPGNGRWMIDSYKATITETDRNGTPTCADVTLSLQEYH